MRAYVEAESVEHAVSVLQSGDDYRMIGGGTGLMLMAQAGFYEAHGLVSLRRAADPSLGRIAVEDGALRLGGQCTLSQIARDPTVSVALPVLAATIRRVSSARTRNVATLAGCLAHGDPHMDLPPLLVVLGAQVEVVGPQGRRRVDCADLFRGYYDVALDDAEVIVGCVVPLPADLGLTRYRKFTGALVEDWPIVGVATRLEVEHDRIASARVAVSALEPTTRRLADVEGLLVGERLADVDATEVGQVAAASVEPTHDPTTSAWYKCRILAVETTRAVADLQATGTAP